MQRQVPHLRLRRGGTVGRATPELRRGAAFAHGDAEPRALWENTSQLPESDVKDELLQQLCGFIQHRLVLAQTAAAQPPSLPTPSDVRVKARRGGGMGPRRGRSQR